MSRKNPTYLILVAVLTLVCLTAGIAMAAPVTQSITYQGKLTNAAGSPLTGTYSVTFKLYDASTGGTTLSTDTHSVIATNGLFTTSIAVTDSKSVDGRALWLGIKVGSDPEMTPRQEIRPVPYALSLRPGAVITGDAGANPSLKVINTGANVASLIAGTTGTNSPALFASAQGTGSPAVYALSPNDIGVYGSGKTGAYFTSNLGGTASTEHAAVNVTTVYDFNPGIGVLTTGAYSKGVSVLTRGIYGGGMYVRSEGQYSAGLDAHMRESDSVGVLAVTYDDNSIGVFGMSEGADCIGVEAYSTGPRSDAVSALAQGFGGRGVYGESSYSTGVSGKGKEGGSFTTNQAGNAANIYPGVNVSTAFAWNPGIQVRTTGSDSPGISTVTGSTNSDGFNAITNGYNSDGLDSYTTGDYSYGLYARATGAASRGVYAVSQQSEGVIGSGVSAAGVKGESTNKAGVWGVSTNDVGVYAVTDRTDNKYGVYTPDRISALAYDTNAGDVAEYMPVTGGISPGTVLVIGKGGILSPSSAAYDTHVAGIISTAPGVSLGTKEGGNAGEALVAVAGRVPCRVDASYGAILEGDLLTSSPTTGHAMRAEPVTIDGIELYRPGTVIGKAMGSLQSGTGAIEVLVTLQ
ncbi:MAG: hypothetical protein EHM53_08400 [Methanoregulaceae archaeon]|nr:MAG: hypothetical protein EHM53_08400 [Methanoregulaceae archaeon]